MDCIDRYYGTHALESVLGIGAGWLQTLQHCSLVCRDVQVVLYSYHILCRYHHVTSPPPAAAQFRTTQGGARTSSSPLNATVDSILNSWSKQRHV